MIVAKDKAGDDLASVRLSTPGFNARVASVEEEGESRDSHAERMDEVFA